MLLTGCVLMPGSPVLGLMMPCPASSSTYAIRRSFRPATLSKSASSHTGRAPGTSLLQDHLLQHRKSGRRWRSQYPRQYHLLQLQVQRRLRNRLMRVAARVCSPTAVTTRTQTPHPTPTDPKRQMKQFCQSRLQSGYAATTQMRWRTIQTLLTSLRKCRSRRCSASSA